MPTHLMPRKACKPQRVPPLSNPRIEFELQPALSGTDVDIGELQAGFVNIGRERLFHADRRTTAADIPRQRKQFLHRNEVALLVSGHLGGQFQVYFVLVRE